MKLWIDDIRPAPEGYIWAKSVKEAQIVLKEFNSLLYKLQYSEEYSIKLSQYLGDVITREMIIDLDHDAGEYVSDGGDYIKLLDWLECQHFAKNYSYHIHSQNPVGVENMRRVIRRNGWKEI